MGPGLKVMSNSAPTAFEREKNLLGAFLQVAGAGPMAEHSQGASTHPGQPGCLPLGTTP